jgi:hypothetical protein
MTTDTKMSVRDLYVRITDAQGRTRVECRRVWDADRFFQARFEEAVRLRDSKPDDVQIYAPATREEYLESRRPA